MPMPHTDWEMTLLDAFPPVAREQGLGAFACGDIDGDGRVEFAVSGFGALLWYRPATCERGVIARGVFHVGLVVEDVDGDGVLEVVTPQAVDPADMSRDYVPENQYAPHHMVMAYFKPGRRLTDPWTRRVIDADGPGAHDLLFADVDGDGRRELIANHVNRGKGLYVYKPGADVTRPWAKHAVQQGGMEEGLAVGDFDGDGRMEIASGVHLYQQPKDGPWSGPWRRSTFAPDHREMCRLAAVDVNGDGRPDLVCIDSEYFEGQFSWFENAGLDAERRPRWIEHPIERGIVYGHSLDARRDEASGRVSIFLGEMAGGGWDAPYNYDARLMEYVTTDGGRSFRRELLHQGAGTHEATRFDIDGDGELEIAGKEWRRSKVHFWKKAKQRSPILSYRHEFIDLDKPGLCTDILAADVDGDGLQDVVTGRWWYHAPTWRRFEIPGVNQVIAAHDIDGDGRVELIGTKARPGKSDYEALTSELVWLKAVDPLGGKWEAHEIGVGAGDWPHGALVAPLLPGRRPALLCAYHSAHASKDGRAHHPELFEVPADPTRPWPRRELAPIVYGEEMAACDVDGDGVLDVVAGPWWLRNRGDGTFEPHTIVEGLYPARLAACDVNGDGRPDVVLGEEVLDFEKRRTPFSRLVWCANPGDTKAKQWTTHVIDTVRCAHSLAAADLDGDGQAEIVCGEHDPFYPYRARCRLFVYKKADPAGRTWKRYTLDDRFEHHDGTKIIDLGHGRKGVISIGWKETIYVHLWRMEG